MKRFNIDAGSGNLIEAKVGEFIRADEALALVKGCFDYGGGYLANASKLEIYRHGIQTVVNALTGALEHASDLQSDVLIAIGQREAKPDPEEGDPCPYEDCKGTMGYEPVKDCSCHICPPCSQCVDNPLRCMECGWTVGDELAPVQKQEAESTAVANQQRCQGACGHGLGKCSGQVRHYRSLLEDGTRCMGSDAWYCDTAHGADIQLCDEVCGGSLELLDATCPQCGSDASRDELRQNEGYCERCCRENQQALDDHNAMQSRWDRMSDAEKDAAIRDAF